MEAQFKHTPGTWHFDSSDMNIYTGLGTGIATIHRRAKVVGIDDIEKSGLSIETQANGKLLAAAPELLAALQMALVEIKGAYSVTEWVNDDMVKMAEDKVRMIEDAIKKATES